MINFAGTIKEKVVFMAYQVPLRIYEKVLSVTLQLNNNIGRKLYIFDKI